MNEFYVGLMSGTSIDGIDAALVDFSQSKPRLVETHYTAYSPALRQEILALCQSGENEIERIAKLDVALGKAFAESTLTLLKKNKIDAKEVRAIGSHGQTIRHLPAQSFTLQIGDPNIIAAETGITTIADFRRRDMALGGQGAPLVPAFHHSIFAEKNIHRAIVNIGGIANVTLLAADGTVSGFDTGPGNTLLDAWANLHLHKPCDDGGKWAATGEINFSLLEALLNDPYLLLPAPKSTGREYFNLHWLNQYLTEIIPAADVQRTLTEFTAESIIKALPFTEGEIFVCGGGTQNHFLMSSLKQRAKSLSLETTDKLGVHPDWVEAMAFAWLAKQTLENKTGNMPSVTGAKKTALLGGIYFA